MKSSTQKGLIYRPNPARQLILFFSACGAMRNLAYFTLHMEYGISHDREDESLEAKARWFLEKPVEERLREAFEGMVLVQKLRKFEPPDDRKTFKTFRVLEQKRG